MAYPKYIRELGEQGRRLWRSLTEEHELEVYEQSLLLQACRIADRLEAIQEEMKDQPQTLTNAKGDTVTHPLIVESRQQSLALARLIASLRIPEEDGARPQRRGGARGSYGIRGVVS